MSLVQGYSSSSEDEVDMEEGSAVQSHRPLSSSSLTNFPPLPNPRRRPQGAPIALPLLEEVDADAQGESDSDDEGESTDEADVQATADTKATTSHHQLQALREYHSDLTHGAVRKRTRHADLDSDGDELIDHAPAKVPRVQHLPVGKAGLADFGGDSSRESQVRHLDDEGIEFESTSNKATKLRAGETESKVREMMARGGESDELKRATAQGVIFSEVTSNDIRSDALRFQQAGVTANLQKLKGVTGRQNQISHLAQVAMRQRDQKKQ